MAKYLDQTGLAYFWGKIKGWVNSSQHPINSLYLTMGTEDPAKLFGGTWKKITSGMLNASASGAGKTGGSSTATLTADNLPAHTHSYTKATSVANHAVTANEMPNHQHSNNARINWFDELGHGLLGNGWAANSNIRVDAGSNLTGSNGGNAGHSHGLNTGSASTGSAGSGSAFSIMPPYINVYVWQRTA